MKIKPRPLFLSLSLLALVLLPTVATPASLTWGGGVNGFWTNAANWTPSFRPTNGDSLLFPAGPARLTTTNTPGGATNFRALTFHGSNYFLYSSPLSLTNGLTNAPLAVGASNTIMARLTLRATQTWATVSGSHLVLNSNVNLTNLTLNVLNEGGIQFNTGLNGGANTRLLNNGAGRLHLARGTSTLTEVILQLGSLQADGVLNSGLMLSTTASLGGTGTVSQFSAAGPVGAGNDGPGVLTIQGAASTFLSGSTLSFDLQGVAPGAGHDQLRVSLPPLLSGATLELVPGYNPLLGDTFVIITNTGASPFSSVFSGLPEGSTQTVNNVQYRITYSGGTGKDVTLSVVGFTASPTTAVWDGGGGNSGWQTGLNWTNDLPPAGGENLLFPPGAAQLTSLNNFPNGMVFNAVTLQTNSYFITGNSVTLLGGIRASHTTGSVFFHAPLHFYGAQTVRVDHAFRTLHLGLGDMALSNSGVLTVEGAGITSLNGQLGGTGGLDLRGHATLGGVNSYSGVTHVFSGSMVSLVTPQSLGSAAPGDDTLVEAGGSLFPLASMTNAEPVRLAGRLGSPAPLSWSGPITLLGSTAILEPFNGATLTIISSLRGTNVLATQQGDGTLILSASNSVTGTLLLNEGSLMINGASPGLDPFLNGGVLGGTGEVRNIHATLASVVQPGLNGRGVLTCSNFTVTGNTSIFYVEVSAGVHNQLRVRNSVQLQGTLLVATAFNPAPGVPFIIVNNEGPTPVSGTFSTLPEGSSTTFGGLTYRVSYAGGDGNDVTLELTGVAASGVTRIWDAGGANNFWSNRTNWSGDTLPEVGDALLFPAILPGADFLTTNDFPADMIFDQLIVRNGSSGADTVLHGQGIALLNGVRATNTSGGFRVQLPLQLLDAQSFVISNAPITFGGPLTLGADLTVGGDFAGAISITGMVSGAGGILKTGPSQLILSGNNTFDGAVKILNGSVTAGQATALGAAGGGTFIGSGSSLLLAFNGALAENFLSVTGLLAISADCAIGGEIQLPNPFTPISAPAGRQLVLVGRLTGAGSPLFQGGGTFFLTGTNDCAAETSLQNATLRVDGRSSAGDLTVNTGSVLGGTGVVGRVTVANGGTINPGASPGRLSASNVSFTLPSTLLLELNGPNSGTQQDQLNVNGSVSLAGGSLLLAFGFTPLIGSPFTLLVNDGVDGISGSFNALPEGATITTNALTFRISYLGGDGNDVVITRVLAASGVTRTWDGGGANAAWSNRFNWVGDLLPAEGDSLVFPSAGSRKNNTNDFPAFFGFNALTIADGYTLHGAGVTLNAGMMATNGGAPTVNVPVLLNSNQSNFIAAGTTLTIGGGINLGPHTLNWGVDGQLVLNGPVSGSGGWSKRGAGGLTLSGTNTHLGLTELRGGNVIVNSSNVFGSAVGETVVGAGTVLQFPAGVTVDERFVLEGIASSPTTLQFVSGTSTFSGSIVLGADLASVRINVPAGEVRMGGSLSGGSFTKEGLGRLVLSGNNTHTNVSILAAGTLLINGPQPSSPVQMNAAPGSLLGGTGTVGTVTTFGGTLSPGASPGRLSIAGGLSQTASVTNFFEIDGPDADNGHDQIVVQGTVSLNGSALRLSFGYVPAFGDAFTLINNQGLNPVSGTFAGLPQGTLITNGPVVMRLTYLGGTGNDVVLTRIAVATGVTRVWDGGGAGDSWTDPVNWAGDVMPQQGDDLIFPGTVAKAPRFDAGTNVALNTLLLGRDYTINASPGHTLRLISGLSATNPSGVVNLTMPIILENSQSWHVTQPGGSLQTRALNLSFVTLTHSGAGNVELLGAITGSGGLVGNSSASLIVDGANTFEGTVVVNSGTLTVRAPGALGSSSGGTFIGTAGRLSLNLPPGASIGESLLLAGRMDIVSAVTNAWSGSIVLAGAQVAFDTSTLGQIDLNGAMSGSGFQTLNLGTIVLNGADSFNGPVRVSGASRLLVNSAHAGVTIVLTNDGRLGGTGVVGVISAPLCDTCEIQPGPANGPGVLHSGDVNLGSSSRLSAQLNGVLPGGGYDQLDVSGAVTLNNASLIVTVGFNPDAGASFTLIRNDGGEPITGIFNGLPQNAFFTNGAVTFQISYTGGDGNDVVVTRVNGVPTSTIQPLVLSNGVAILTGAGQPGVAYVLEATAHLTLPIPWQPILTNNSDGAGRFEFRDFGATNHPMRFYRVRSQ